MTSLLRALRPQRNEIKKLINEKPLFTQVPQAEAAREAFLVDVEIFKTNLTATKASFSELQQKLLALEPQTTENQKIVDDLAEGESKNLLHANKILTEVNIALKHYQS